MNRLTILTWSVAICLVLLVVAGCTLRNSPEVRYYSLLNVEQLAEDERLASLPEVRLGIGPVSIADSLKRTQIVTRVDQNQYHFDEFNRWAGPLDDDLASVVGVNLGLLLGTNYVDFFPWRQYFKPTYRVLFNVERLDGALGGEAVLEVRWTIIGADDSKVLAENRSVYRLSAKGNDFSALVSAESRLVAEFCRELARVIARGR
ncbi:MAG: membrane integrity-associated transporter subunit PqiC [Desulfopila sp.]